MGKQGREIWERGVMEEPWGQITYNEPSEGHPAPPTLRCQLCLHTVWTCPSGGQDSAEKGAAQGLTPTSLADCPGLQEGNLATVRFH